MALKRRLQDEDITHALNLDSDSVASASQDISPYQSDSDRDDRTDTLWADSIHSNTQVYRQFQWVKTK
jgi:hypothetical protein